MNHGVDETAGVSHLCLGVLVECAKTMCENDYSRLCGPNIQLDVIVMG